MSERSYITTAFEGSDESLRIKNTLQIELMKRSGMTPEDWIEANSSKFRGAFHRLLVKDPHLVEHHAQTPDVTLELIEAEMKGESEIDSEVLEEAA